MIIEMKKMTPTAREPYAATEYSAGSDLWGDNDEEVVIQPHTCKLIGTGLAVAIPKGYFGAIYARSGLATKKGLRPANCVGVIDSDYRGEVMVACHNDTDEPKTIGPHERIAQIIIQKCEPVVFKPVDTLDDTERGKGGFGSTGTGYENVEK